MPFVALQSEKIKAVLRKLLGALPVLIVALFVASQFFARGGPEKGAMVPAINLHPVNHQANASTHAEPGKTKLLNFWAEWCGPCRQEVPELNQVSKRIDILGLAVRSGDGATLAARATQLGIRFDVANAPPALLTKLHVEMLPTSVLVDEQGQVLASWTGGVTAEAVLAAVNKHHAK